MKAGPPPASPELHQEAILQHALSEYDRMSGRLLDMLEEVRAGRVDFAKVTSLLARFDYLQADARVASYIAGLMVPWLPGIQDNPAHAPTVKPVKLDLAIQSIYNLLPTGYDPAEILDDEYRYPHLEDAVNWLEEKRVVTPGELARLSAEQQHEAFSLPGVNSRSTILEFKQALADSTRKGESLYEFRQRAKEIVDLNKAEEATIYRTETKGAYVSGLEKVLGNPEVERQIPYVMYVATHDSRVRHWHWDMNGVVCSRNDRTYQVMLRLLRQYNCRCSIIPLTEAEAKKRGISTYSDVPQDVLDNLK